jgi:site-specific recombinase XerD
MILIAPHITAFLQQRLPIERRASPNTCDSYAHAFRLLFEYASDCVKLPPSQLCLEQIDASLIVNFLNHLETTRGNSAGSRNIRLAAIKSFMHYMERLRAFSEHGRKGAWDNVSELTAARKIRGQ